jgi:hypothetical protein
MITTLHILSKSSAITHPFKAIALLFKALLTNSQVNKYVCVAMYDGKLKQIVLQVLNFNASIFGHFMNNKLNVASPHG